MRDNQPPSAITLITASVFVFITALLLYFHGNRIVWSNDEGIILDASLRMLNGQTLYRDFFGYMTPYSYWIQKAVFAVFGVSIPIIIVLSMVSLGFVEDTATHVRAGVAVATPIGTVRASPADRDGVQKLLACVRPGDTLYVHPYRPILYVLTQAHNPTRYSYMWPGLMTAGDAAAALRDLTQRPPKAVMFLEVERDEYLRVFPNAYNLNHRFPNIEDWIAREYVPVEPPVSVSGYRLYLRAPRASHPAGPSCD